MSGDSFVKKKIILIINESSNLPIIKVCLFEQINIDCGVVMYFVYFLKTHSDYYIRSTPLFYCVSNDRCR